MLASFLFIALHNTSHDTTFTYNEMLSLYIYGRTACDDKMIRFWIIGRRSNRSCRWHGQGSAQGNRCDAVLFGRSASIRYIITCLIISFFSMQHSNYFCLLADVLSSLSSMSSLTPEQSANATPDASLQPSSINSAQRYFICTFFIFFSRLIYIYGIVVRSSAGRRKNRELTIVSVAHTNIPPKEPVVYSKQTQTIQTTHTSHDGESIFLLYLFIYLYCTYVLYLTRDFATKRLDIRKTCISDNLIHNVFTDINIDGIEI